jgi:hypothetical protein
MIVRLIPAGVLGLLSMTVGQECPVDPFGCPPSFYRPPESVGPCIPMPGYGPLLDMQSRGYVPEGAELVSPSPHTSFRERSVLALPRVAPSGPPYERLALIGRILFCLVIAWSVEHARFIMSQARREVHR